MHKLTPCPPLMLPNPGRLLCPTLGRCGFTPHAPVLPPSPCPRRPQESKRRRCLLDVLSPCSDLDVAGPPAVSGRDGSAGMRRAMSVGASTSAALRPAWTPSPARGEAATRKLEAAPPPPAVSRQPGLLMQSQAVRVVTGGLLAAPGLSGLEAAPEQQRKT